MLGRPVEERSSAFAMGSESLFSSRLEHAVRLSAAWHGDQVRKGVRTPYITHPMAVSLILARLGFEETTLVAALLHDTVEDTPATLDDVEREFGAEARALVAGCSEQKLDDEGRPLPWSVRKRSHLERLAGADRRIRAIKLADQLHNLKSMMGDLEAGVDIWSLFHADRPAWLAHARHLINVLAADEVTGSPLHLLASTCRKALDRLERV